MTLERISDRIPGAGIDASPDRRPGVPMEADPPRPIGDPHWTYPERQADPGYIQRRKGLEQLTPVFGTKQPPRLLSGLLRRLAYQIPEHRPTHWLLLLVADRVDVLEHDALRTAPVALGVLGGLAVASSLVARRRRRSRWLR
ncbi:MAG: hypothetical protein JOZ69_01320 [Myxococcales bacterium]|nr:hypothetical protein [Myxococcales bacterium]